jgi:lipoprotein-anchoring transpeptidase ErfK/SrfK
VSTTVTSALVVCALAVGAAGAGFAKEREQGRAASAGVGSRAAERIELFAGGAGPDDGHVTRVARRTARSARVHATAGTVATVRRGAKVSLHGRPGGPALATLADRTPFGSPNALAVVRRRPGWLGVLSSLIHNGEVGWIRDDSRAVTLGGNRVRVVVDRSEQRLDLLRGRRRLMSVAVGVGRPGSETPAGRFAVTDRLSGARYRGAYGCCVIALTGNQPRLPAGWRGGDRLALHGTDGRSAPSVRSAGCVTVDREPLERLVRSVPLGTVVTIRP